MRKLVESTFVTLDGVIENPHHWSPPYWDDEHSAYAGKLLFDLTPFSSGARPTKDSRRHGRRAAATSTRTRSMRCPSSSRRAR